MKRVSLLFVCMGNICRSPALAATFLSLAKKRGVADRFLVDSAAVTTCYLGQSADYRMCKAAEKKNIHIEHTAQLFEKKDFSKFDHILAVNCAVKELLLELASNEGERKKVILATRFAKKFKDKEIPDPYFHDGKAFDRVMDMALDACEGFLDHLSVKGVL